MVACCGSDRVGAPEPSTTPRLAQRVRNAVVTPYECGAIRYAITPHPEYDPSGKTLLVTWTDHNVIKAIRITWR